MGSKSTLEEDPDLPENKLWEEWLLVVDDDNKRPANTRTGVGRGDRHNRFKQAPGTHRGTFAHLQLSCETRDSQIPGSESPGFFSTPFT